MALMLSKTYDALVAAGAPEDKARAAAEEIASLDERLNRIDRRLIRLEVVTSAGAVGILILLLKAFV